jgi:caffeoyl-CoA O-methyltransferase
MPMARVKTTVTEGVADYLARHSRQDDVLARVERETAARPDAMMQVTPDEGALLGMLARLVGARQALEVGTFTGYSAICIARGLGEHGSLLCLEIDPGYAATARRNLASAGLQDRAEVRVGPAAQSLKELPELEAYDFAFVDADKPGYPEYYELVLSRLRPGGVMLIDNVLYGGRILEPDGPGAEAIDALNRKIATDERVDCAMVAISDGIMFVRKR